MNAAHILLSLLLLLLPTQLGYHFFLPFSFINGVPIDYLAPTIYLTDLVIGILFLTTVWLSRHSYRKNIQKNAGIPTLLKSASARWFSVWIVTLLVAAVSIAPNHGAAIYKVIKILEFATLGYAVWMLKPPIIRVVSLLSVGVAYTSLLAIWQASIQHTVGGLWWWMGERTFSASTPGIALFTINGALLLRPYATFPHPNVLGGFLAVVVPAMVSAFQRESFSKGAKIALGCAIGLGLVGLFLSFSQAAWFVGCIGLLLGIKKLRIKITSWFKGKARYGAMMGLLMISLMAPFLFSEYSQSILERRALLEKAFFHIQRSPFLGVGLNNSLQADLHSSSPNIFYRFQPVHNVYVLLLTETGFLGLSFFMMYLLSLRPYFTPQYSVGIALFQLFLLGLFDHYLVTVQQGQLLLVLFASLAFFSKGAYTGKSN